MSTASSAGLPAGQSVRQRAERVDLAILLALALLHGLIYWALVPPWQHYDEPTHFEYAQLLALRGYIRGFIDFEPEWRAAIADSMYRFRFDPPGIRRTLANPLAPDIGVSELNHPRAYYRLAAVPVALLAVYPVEAQLYGARLVSLGFYLLAVVCAFQVGRVLAPDSPWLRRGLALLMLLSPTFSDIMTAVNNDALANFTGAAFFLGCVLLIRDGPTRVGLALTLLSIAAALLAKRSTIMLLPLLPLALYWMAVRRPLRWWVYGALAGASLLLAALLIFQLPQAGATARAASQPAPTPAPDERVFSTQSRPAQAGPPLTVRPWVDRTVERVLRVSPSSMVALALDWERNEALYPLAMRNLLYSSTIRLGWNHVDMPAIWRPYVAGGVAVVALGLVLRPLRRWMGWLDAAPPVWRGRADWLAFWALLIGLAVVLTYLFAPPFFPYFYLPSGRYLFVVMLPMLLLLVRGIEGWLPTRLQALAPLLPVPFFLLLDIGAIWTLVRFFYQ